MLCLIENEARDYAWGSQTEIPQFYGRTPSGAPEAEVWLGDHPGSPARLSATGDPLPQLLAELGHQPLTFLLKLLAANEVLSIQVHPSKEQAEAGFTREEASGISRDAANRNYRDDNHKPELIVALSEEFVALAGIRPLKQTLKLIESLGESTLELLAQFDSELPAEQQLRDAIAWALSPAADATSRALSNALPEISASEWMLELEVYRTIAKLYPGDRGLLVALLLNVVVLTRGEALALGAGVPHAYVRGFGVELMAASDNVLRGGLTPKHIDVPELLSILRTEPSDEVKLAPRKLAPGVSAFYSEVPDFELLRVDLSGQDEVRLQLRSAAIAVQISGAAVITSVSSAEQLDLEASQAAFISEDEGVVLLKGSGEIFIAQSGF